MKQGLLLILFFATFFKAEAQFHSLIESQYKNVQTLEKDLAIAKTGSQKTDALISLYLYHSLHNEEANRKAALEYQRQLEIYVHESDEPNLIAKALFYTIRPVSGDEKKKRIDRLFAYAKLHNLDFWKAQAKNAEASYYFTFHQDRNKSIQSVNEAMAFSKDLTDSLQALIILEAAGRLNGINSPMQALELAFKGHEIALKIQNIYLLALSNSIFSSIYSRLKNWDKSIEYGKKELDLLKKQDRMHLFARKHAFLANDFFMSQQPLLGNHHVSEAYRIADSLKASKRLYNEMTGGIMTTLARSDNDETLKTYLKSYRKHFFIFPNSDFADNVTLAVSFAKIGNMDSARALITKAGSFLSKENTGSILRVYHYTLARLAGHDGDFSLAAEHWKKALDRGLAQNNLDFSLNYIDSLKRILTKQRLYQDAFYYYNLGDSVKAEFNKQADDEEITRQEIAALEKEKELLYFQKEREKNQRHNVQYLGITFGVVALFISLLVMGIFKASTRTIKVLSFFSFLLFFEFIFLIFKKQIAIVTNGEPWKDLFFMVLLAAIMVPLHHWVEKRVVEYLSTKKIYLPKIRLSKKDLPSQKQEVT